MYENDMDRPSKGAEEMEKQIKWHSRVPEFVQAFDFHGVYSMDQLMVHHAAAQEPHQGGVVPKPAV